MTTDPNAKAPTLEPPRYTAGTRVLVEAEVAENGTFDFRSSDALEGRLQWRTLPNHVIVHGTVDELQRVLRELEVLENQNATLHEAISRLESDAELVEARAKLEVVEKQRDNAQQQRDEARASLKRLEDGLAERGYSIGTTHEAALALMWRDLDGLRAALLKVSGHFDTSAATNHDDVAEMVLAERRKAVLSVSAAGHDAIESVCAERDEARGQLNALVAEVEEIAGMCEDGYTAVGGFPVNRLNIAPMLRRAARQAIATTAPQTAPRKSEFVLAVNRAVLVDDGGQWKRFVVESWRWRADCYMAVMLAPSEPRSDDKPAADGAVTEEPTELAPGTPYGLMPAAPPCGHRSGIHDEYCDMINEAADEGRDEANAACIEELAGVLDIEVPDDLPADVVWDRLIEHLREVMHEAEKAFAACDEAQGLLTALRDGLAALGFGPSGVSGGAVFDALSAISLLAKVRDESANTIAALHKAADEHTKEIARLQELVGEARAKYVQAILDGGYELGALRDGVGAVAEEMDAVGVVLDDMTIWSARLRALLASPTSSATTTEEGRSDG